MFICSLHAPDHHLAYIANQSSALTGSYCARQYIFNNFYNMRTVYAICHVVTLTAVQLAGI